MKAVRVLDLTKLTAHELAWLADEGYDVAPEITRRVHLVSERLDASRRLVEQSRDVH